MHFVPAGRIRFGRPAAGFIQPDFFQFMRPLVKASVSCENYSR